MSMLSKPPLKLPLAIRRPSKALRVTTLKPMSSLFALSTKKTVKPLLFALLTEKTVKPTVVEDVAAYVVACQSIIIGVVGAIIVRIVEITAAEVDSTDPTPSVDTTVDATFVASALARKLSSNTTAHEEDDADTCSSFVVDSRC